MNPILGPGYHDRMFCDDDKTRSHLFYYTPGNHYAPPIPHRPTWKGATGTPNQRPDNLIETPETNYGMSSGFTVDGGPYAMYSNNVDMESSLRTLDQPLNKGRWGQKSFGNQSNLYSANHVKNSHIVKDHPMCRPETACAYNNDPCENPHKYNHDNMNMALFNNSTRMTTKNLKLR